MLRSAWRVLKPGGYLFARLASDIGIESLVTPLGNSRYALPDGSERFLVNEQILMEYTGELKGELFEPIKTTNVQNLRCMTTWCLRKNKVRLAFIMPGTLCKYLPNPIADGGNRLALSR
jgi:tellurite methyltransferase